MFAFIRALFGACPASSTGGHYFVKEGGQWVCTMCGQAR